ncbi:GINS complex subunit 2 [Nematocida major]|uniref:GINS complex subunit 2 n=1 Tax=Nematocida major TaxID=1912982 RepID=UPI0020088296|nr:GINS complex subunit 2 [Nematocida major]KAH9386177.1 GINS complex subunit 2 [Nematocida major]
MSLGLLRSSDDLHGNAEFRIQREREAERMIAQGEMVTIIPAVHMEKLEMAVGTFGPFSPMAPCMVPLYVALFLRHSLLCTIQAPEWLSVQYLQRAIEREEETTGEFGAISMHLFENAETCLEACDVRENVSEVRILLKRLGEMRMKKLLKGVEYIDTPVIGMNNLTLYEFRRIKEYITPHLSMQKAFSKGLNK